MGPGAHLHPLLPVLLRGGSTSCLASHPHGNLCPCCDGDPRIAQSGSGLPHRPLLRRNTPNPSRITHRPRSSGLLLPHTRHVPPSTMGQLAYPAFPVAGYAVGCRGISLLATYRKPACMDCI